MDDRAAATDWLVRRHGVPAPYPAEAALALLDPGDGCRPGDLLAAVYPSRAAAADYARATAKLWGLPTLGPAADADGQVIAATDLRPFLRQHQITWDG